MTGYTFNQLFDFTRTTAATFVGSNGLIQTTPASINVLTFTQEFDNAVWSKIGLGTGSPPTVTANAAIAPDGTSTADLVAFNRGAGNAIGDRSTINSLPTVVNGLTYVASIYIKAATAGDIGKQVAFRGVAGVGYQVITLTADWVRISSAELSSGTTGNFELASRGTISADNQVSALLWGAQLELGSTATTYARNNGGLFPPRFEYDPVTLAPRGILIEEQRTNLIWYSNAFTTSPWGLDTNADLIANSTASPDGAINAWKMAAKNGLVSIGSSQFFIKAASAITYNTSIFSKAAGYDWLQIAVFDGANGNRYWFNVRTGAIGTTAVIGTGFTGVSASITPAPNGFFRCSLIATSSTATSYSIYLYPSATNGSNGTGNTNGDGVYVYGAQIEAGAFATSYIPTVASQVTRTADVCTISAPMFAPWYNQNEGTVVWEGSFFATSIVSGLFSNNDGSSSNRVDFRTNSSGFVSVGGVTQASFSVSPLPINTANKVAVAVRLNDFAAVANGGALSTDASGTVPTVSRMLVGALDAGANQLNGHIRRITYYPFRASNNQIQALST